MEEPYATEKFVIEEVERTLRLECEGHSDLEEKINRFKYNYLVENKLIEFDEKDTRKTEVSYEEDSKIFKTKEYGLRTKFPVSFNIKVTEDFLKLLSLPDEYIVFSLSENREKIADLEIDWKSPLVDFYKPLLGKYVKFILDQD